MCSGCGRLNSHGNGVNPNLKMTEILLDDYKRILNKDVCNQLDFVFFCGTYGDTLASPNIIECLNYIRSNGLKLNINTNGCMGNKGFWKELARTLGPECLVIFSIDGITKEINKIYRVNSNAEVALKNAKVFIDAGGSARWDFIKFDHSLEQLEQAKKIAKEIGFKTFVSIKPRAFKNEMMIENFKKNNYTGKNKDIKNLFDKYDSWENYMKTTKIECRTRKNKEVYIDHSLRLWPCPWIGGPLYLDATINMQKIRTSEIVNKYGEDFNSLKTKSIKDVMDHDFFKYDLEKTWLNNNDRMPHCVKMCGESYRDCSTDNDHREITSFERKG